MNNRNSLWGVSASMGLTLLVLIAAAGAVLPVSAADETRTSEKDYPNAHLLVDTDWLLEHLDEETVRIIDMRSQNAYKEAHVPGAVNVPVEDIFAVVNDIPFKFDRRKVQDVLNRIGLMPKMTAVIYDNLGMMNSARMFWTLEYIGHENIRVLNGGWNAWEAAELQTTGKTQEIEASDYPIQLESDKIADLEQVLDRLYDPDVIFVDARSPQEYRGEVSFSERAGHIPGSVNLVWLDALTGGDAVFTTESNWPARLRDEDVEVFKQASEIETMLQDLEIPRNKQIITYCQTLWRGAHVYFLFRLMDYEDVRGYDGSWAEWGNRSDVPIVKGSERMRQGAS